MLPCGQSRPIPQPRQPPLAIPSWARRALGGTRAALLEELQLGPYTILDLARRLDLTAHTVRAHLQVLERDGFVERRLLRRAARGKPAFQYWITRDATLHLSSAYPAVMLLLVRAMHERLSPADMTALVRASGRQLALRIRPTASDPSRSPIDDAAAAFTALGGAAEVMERAHHRVLMSRCCPLAAIAGQTPGGCELFESFLSEITGVPVRQRCTQEPGGARCQFDVARELAAPDASGHVGE
jgi:predicted ArsR family transcriptional regulator